MALGHTSKTVTNGLVFAYDMSNRDKSWKGKPTINYAHSQNPRIDSSYAPYVATTSGTWPVKHFDAITVYNQAGQNITPYDNTGVTDWTNTYHAIWTYDQILKKPVVTMRDADGQWKAKTFTIPSMTTMGLTHGSTYSISWLQWTTNISKCVAAGVYQRRSSDGVYNFYDGLSDGQSTAFNTLPGTWQRVYGTYTVTAGMDLSITPGVYMYGMSGPRGTIKVADVQFETGVPSGFHNAQTRTNTQALLDLTNNNTITASSLTYAANGSFSFNGSTDYITTPLSLGATDPVVSVNMWIKRTADFTGAGYWGLGGGSPNNGINGYTSVTNKIGWDLWGQTTFHTGQDYPLNQWVNVCWVKTGATFTTSTLKVYINGVEYPLTTTIRNNSSSVNIITGFNVGRLSADVNAYYAPGEVGMTAVYNRALTQEEVQQNFNALRGRYGI